jgi:hypothetical protein
VAEQQRQREAQQAEMAKRGVAIKGQESASDAAINRDLDQALKKEYGGTSGGRVASGGGGGASQPDPRSTQGVVNQQRAQSAGAQYDYSSKTTSINQSNMFGNRGQRVSPLSQSWMFPFQPQSQQLRIVQGGGMKWAMVGVGLLFAAGLVLAFKD